MNVVEEIKVINIDGQPVAVDQCSERVQQLMSFYNDWRTEEYAEKKAVLKTEAALRDLSREIVALVQAEQKADAEAAAEDAANDSVEGDAEVAAPADLPDGTVAVTGDDAAPETETPAE